MNQNIYCINQNYLFIYIKVCFFLVSIYSSDFLFRYINFRGIYLIIYSIKILSLIRKSEYADKYFSVTNQISLTEDDVSIANEKGNQVYYIKAPGNYTINFKKINILQNFGYLTGEIGATLQVSKIIHNPTVCFLL